MEALFFAFVLAQGHYDCTIHCGHKSHQIEHKSFSVFVVSNSWALHHSFIRKGVVPLACEYDMIQNLNLQQLASVFHPSSQINVGWLG